MKVKILGGISIGRSCIYVEDSRGTGVILDAGLNVRCVNENGLYPVIPAEIKKKVKAIFITHAHLDHLGGIVHVWHLTGRPPIYASEVTVRLAPLMLRDTSIVHFHRTGERLLENSEIEDCVSKMRAISPYASVEVESVKVTAYPAGHIMGAYYYRVEGDGTSVVYSGDISLTKQMTVGPADLTNGGESTLVIVESTYGLLELPSRREEESRLIRQVKSHLAAGRRVLIPSFSLGRAQEVILILRQAMESGELSGARVYVDGMVNAVNEVIEEVKHTAITGRGRRFIGSESVFYSENILPVSDEMREAVLTGPPAVIIASPGTLKGGASGWYAARMLNDPNSVIMLVGYADEEAPARLLKNGEIHLADGTRITPRCRVEEYKLSAHAGCSNLISFAKRFNPVRVVLVHGSREAREALASKLGGTAVIPQPGDEIDLSSHLFKAVWESRRKVANAPVVAKGIPVPLLIEQTIPLEAVAKFNEVAERLDRIEKTLVNLIKRMADMEERFRQMEEEKKDTEEREKKETTLPEEGEDWISVPSPFRFARFWLKVPPGVNRDSLVKRVETLARRLYEEAKKAVETPEGKRVFLLARDLPVILEGRSRKEVAEELGLPKDSVVYAAKRLEALPDKRVVSEIDNIVDVHAVMRLSASRSLTEKLWEMLEKEFAVKVKVPHMRDPQCRIDVFLDPEKKKKKRRR